MVIGHSPTKLIAKEPWGKTDLIGGTTLSRNGQGIRLRRTNFGYRWMVEPIGACACRYAPGKGWAVVVDCIR
ncbi:MAG: hypothetical protein R6W06_02400 [Prochlorococcaceae cyanobacterium]